MSLRSSTSISQISRAGSIQSGSYSQSADHAHLKPEHALSAEPSVRKRSSANGISNGITSELRSRKDRRRRRSSETRRRDAQKGTNGPGQWKKLLWVKQAYPDNYTDEETFLDHLQRNPRLRPYEFWPLVADSTIIVQHVCSVIIFICCFTGIFQARVSPQKVVGWATIGTVLGWVLKEYWQSREESQLAAEARAKVEERLTPEGREAESKRHSESSSESAEFGMPFNEQRVPLATMTAASTVQTHSRISSVNSIGSSSSAHITSPLSASIELTPHGSFSPLTPTQSHSQPGWVDSNSSLSPRMQERVTTAKSAILIYCSLLGLSPILKSLTESTSEDSIWALSSWLMILNVFTFDYGAGPEAKFPASLSTNAALMASTVLASRLPNTTHVFSLTLFSIEVFGLFPVFRRHLRHHSWNGHLWLTVLLVIFASGGLSMTISGGGYVMGVVGVILGGMICGLSMGMTSWWLIGLQRYKNEIRGPWDPARPVLRGGWD